MATAKILTSGIYFDIDDKYTEIIGDASYDSELYAFKTLTITNIEEEYVDVILSDPVGWTEEDGLDGEYMIEHNFTATVPKGYYLVFGPFCTTDAAMPSSYAARLYTAVPDDPTERIYITDTAIQIDAIFSSSYDDMTGEWINSFWSDAGTGTGYALYAEIKAGGEIRVCVGGVVRSASPVACVNGIIRTNVSAVKCVGGVIKT